MTLQSFWSPATVGAGGHFGDPRDGGTRKHRGTDYSHGNGTPIPSPIAGVVTGKLAPAPSHGFGYQITIKGDNGIIYSFAHMQSASGLAVGSRVTVGEIIGYEGHTGATTGPCVHVEVLTGGAYRDPAPYIAALVGGGSAPASVGKIVISVPGVTILQVQQHLLARGFSVGPTGADGKNGGNTALGLGTFQSAAGLVRDYNVGPKTWAALTAAAAPTAGAATGPYATIQTALNKFGYGLKVDNVWGNASHNALGDFQKNHGLKRDYLVGPQTRAALGI